MRSQKPFIILFLIIIVSCTQQPDTKKLIKKTIESIDNINSINYKQTLLRGNSMDESSVLMRERKFYYSRLKTDSLIGAKAHIYFFDSSYIFHEDIYDGDRLIRKHNIDSSAKVYDLIKYPALKNKPFWGKTTPYVIQYMLEYSLKNKEHYEFELGNDTLINEKECYHLKTILKKKALMPGFYEFTIDTNRVETVNLFVDKLNFYPQSMRLEIYFLDNPESVYFSDHRFYDIQINPELNDSLFVTSREVIKGFKINEIQP